MTTAKDSLIAAFFVFILIVYTIFYDKAPQTLSTEQIEEEDSVAYGRGSERHNNFRPIPDLEIPPTLKRKDLVYKKSRNTVPVVNEEYNLIFFLVAKTASSEWIRFLMRLQGSENWCMPEIHDRHVNELKFLSDYSIEEAQEMMTSPKWKRAIFVRDPKPRVLSAFLDKAVAHEDHFMNETCVVYANKTGNKGASLDYCIEEHDSFEFFLFSITTTLKKNVHWRSIYSRVDEKWWPYMTYIGNMENLSEDAEEFLQSIHSNIDGASAWDKIGRTGWSDNERDCSNLGHSAFLTKKDVHHKTNAREKMLQYYTPELEEFVENHYADDYENSFFHFSDIRLYPENDGDSSS